MAAINVKGTYASVSIAVPAFASHSQNHTHLEVTAPISEYCYSVKVLKNPLQAL
jgi:hypothetical protein